MMLLLLTFQTQKCGFESKTIVNFHKLWHDKAVTKGVSAMTTRKQLMISTILYIFCALVWAVNFCLHWEMDGELVFSTVLFGVSAVCFAIAAVLNIIRLHRMK